MPDRSLSRWLTILGVLLLIIYAAIACLSHSFSYGQGHQERPIWSFVCLYGVAFSVYAVAVWRVKRQGAEHTPLTLMFIFAVLFRLVLLFSEPIQEDDFYRYLWDGKVVASGLNPYRFAPLDVQMYSGKEGPLRPYRDIADTDEHFAFLLSRVNHPGVPTLYPPVAQAVFGLTALVAPGSLLALRLVFLFFDLAVCVVIVGLLHHLGSSPLWVLIYAWSPLVIKETINSPHYDVVPIFLLLLALRALVSGRTLVGCMSLGGAILGKVFPVVLLPLFAYQAWRRHGLGRAWGGLTIACLVVVAGYAPFVDAGSALWQGSVTFAEQWQTNSFVFPLFRQVMAGRWLANGVVAGCLGGQFLLPYGGIMRGMNYSSCAAASLWWGCCSCSVRSAIRGILCGPCRLCAFSRVLPGCSCPASSGCTTLPFTFSIAASPKLSAGWSGWNIYPFMCCWRGNGGGRGRADALAVQSEA